MADVPVKMIYIGNLPIMDIDETTWDVDDPTLVAGTYTRADMRLTDVVNHDVDDDGAIIDDEGRTGDFISYNVDGTDAAQAVDATISYTAILTEADGTMSKVPVLVIQARNGDTFLVDSGAPGALDNKDIVSIELAEPQTTSAAGYTRTYSVENTTICFADGAVIDTDAGPRPVERLRVGDRVRTLDRGFQPVRWIGMQRLDRAGRHAPVVFSAGSLGAGLPTRELRLSPQHRVLVRSRIAARMFGTPEVLVAAIKLVGLPGITRGDPVAPVRYWHFVCDRHEIVVANGAPVESLLFGPVAEGALPARSLAEIAEIFGQALETLRAPVRPLPPPRRQRRLTERHGRNGQPLVAPG